MRVLIAEDDPISRRLLKTSLEKWQFDVIAAGDGTEAYDIMCGDNPPQLIILDWMMPGMDGVTVCSKIRKELHDTAARYIILLTAKGNRQDVIAGFKAGADDYVTKPFNAQELRVRINAGKRIVALQNTLSANIERLQELDVLKSEFLATVSHELRTPIAVMREGVSLCLDGVAGEVSSMQHEFLGDVLDNIDRLSRLIDDLLDFSKIEAGRVVVTKAPMDICRVAHNAVKQFAVQADEKHITLIEKIPKNPIEIYADEGRIIQVFSNLITNALRFTPSEGSICVEVTDQGPDVACNVSDTGSGIKKENIPRLFRKFQQFDREEGPGYRGTGLGLAIVKGLVEKHGGSIRAESEWGKGSTFSFTLKKDDVPGVLMIPGGNDSGTILSALREEGVPVINAPDFAQGAVLIKTFNIGLILYQSGGAENSSSIDELKTYLCWPEFVLYPAILVLNKAEAENFAYDEIPGPGRIRILHKPAAREALLQAIESVSAEKESL